MSFQTPFSSLRTLDFLSICLGIDSLSAAEGKQIIILKIIIKKTFLPFSLLANLELSYQGSTLMILFTCSILFVSQAELVGTFGGIFSFHSLSQVGLLLVDEQMVSTIWTGKYHFGELYPKTGFCQNSYT